jgi:hypothetical protein
MDTCGHIAVELGYRPNFADKLTSLLHHEARRAGLTSVRKCTHVALAGMSAGFLSTATDAARACQVARRETGDTRSQWSCGERARRNTNGGDNAAGDGDSDTSSSCGWHGASSPSVYHMVFMSLLRPITWHLVLMLVLPCCRRLHSRAPPVLPASCRRPPLTA